ncbi:MAG: hypothetical protein QM757_22530 [Paludibaculum sp.]
MTVREVEVPSRLTPASISSRLTVVVALDTLQPADLDALRPHIRKLYTARKDKSQFDLVLFTSGGFQPLGPYKSLAALDRDLKELLRRPEEQAIAVEPLRFYSEIPRALIAEPDQGWITAVFAGRWPQVPDSMEEYTRAWFGRVFGTRRVRPVFWTPEDAAQPRFFESLSQQFQASIDPPLPDLQELAWDAPTLSDGFMPVVATARDAAGQTMGAWHDFIQKRDFPLPSLEDYFKLRQAVTARAPLPELTLALAANSQGSQWCRLGRRRGSRVEERQCGRALAGGYRGTGAGKSPAVEPVSQRRLRQWFATRGRAHPAESQESESGRSTPRNGPGGCACFRKTCPEL